MHGSLEKFVGQGFESPYLQMLYDPFEGSGPLVRVRPPSTNLPTSSRSPPIFDFAGLPREPALQPFPVLD